GDPNVFDGEYNTDAIIEQIGENGLAAYACRLFTPTPELKDDPLVGQGRWYLGAVQEIADIYGVDYNRITSNRTHFIGDLHAASMWTATADFLNAQGVINNISDMLPTSSSIKRSGTSSEQDATIAWRVQSSGAPASDCGKTSIFYSGTVGCAWYWPIIHFENHYYGVERAPKIGDILYADATYGSTDDYDDSKKVAGVVFWVSDDQTSLKAVNLRFLTFTAYGTPNNFDYEHPYNQKYQTIWSTDAVDFDKIANYYWSAKSPKLVSNPPNSTINVTNEIPPALE
ncbi:MAG: hypothetical protein IJ184_03885, partial [Alphaproteobacteria bacterium]|nr:hypothetical protein [Alphaproteobacteria bacterium]